MFKSGIEKPFRRYSDRIGSTSKLQLVSFTRVAQGIELYEPPHEPGDLILLAVSSSSSGSAGSIPSSYSQVVLVQNNGGSGINNYPFRLAKKIGAGSAVSTLIAASGTTADRQLLVLRGHNDVGVSVGGNPPADMTGLTEGSRIFGFMAGTGGSAVTPQLPYGDIVALTLFQNIAYLTTFGSPADGVFSPNSRLSSLNTKNSIFVEVRTK